MRKSLSALALILIGIVLGNFVGTAMASRSSSGTYQLPAGNPVVSGTSITSTWANTTLGDLATEVTSSLDRNGRGGMLAPLKLPNGTSTAPSMSWTSEPRTGPYRAAAGDIRWQVDGTTVVRWTTTGPLYTLLVTAQAGITATNSTSNGTALVGTGNGTGNGVGGTGGTTSGAGGYFTGGTPNGNGVTAVGTGNGNGVTGTGAGSGWGGNFTGGPSGGEGVRGIGGGDQEGVRGIGGDAGNPSGVFGTGGLPAGPGILGEGTDGGSGGQFLGGAISGLGVLATGGAPNGTGAQGNGTGSGAGGKFFGGSTDGYGVDATGGGSAPGGTFASGTASTGAAPQSALKLTNGNLSLSGVTNPNTTVGFSNTLTPKNVPKAWGYVTTDGVGGATLQDGFNISSCALTGPGTGIICTFATNMANANYAVLISGVGISGTAPIYQSVSSKTTSSFTIGASSYSTIAVGTSFSVMSSQ
jgi:hypothetical protein